MKVITLVIAVLLFSCQSQKKVLNSWIGNNKSSLISTWGPPSKVETIDDGEVLVYSTTRGAMLPGSGQAVGAYDHKMFFCDKMGTIYNWRTQTNYIPPEQLNVNLLVRYQ